MPRGHSDCFVWHVCLSGLTVTENNKYLTKMEQSMPAFHLSLHILFSFSFFFISSLSVLNISKKSWSSSFQTAYYSFQTCGTPIHIFEDVMRLETTAWCQAYIHIYIYIYIIQYMPSQITSFMISCCYKHIIKTQILTHYDLSP